MTRTYPNQALRNEVEEMFILILNHQNRADKFIMIGEDEIAHTLIEQADELIEIVDAISIHLKTDALEHKQEYLKKKLRGEIL